MYKRKYTVPGPQRTEWNGNNKFIKRKHAELFDDTYLLTHGEQVNGDMIESNMEYMMEILREGR